MGRLRSGSPASGVKLNSQKKSSIQLALTGQVQAIQYIIQR